MSIEKYGEEIDAFIHNKMDEERKSAFILLMDKNEKLKGHVNELLELKSQYLSQDVYQLKKKLEEFSKKHPIEINDNKSKSAKDNAPKGKLISFFKKPAVSIAASLIIVLGISYTFLSNNDDKLLANNFEKNYPFEITNVRGSGGNAWEVLELMLRKQKYNRFITSSKEALTISPEFSADYAEKLYQGQVYAYIGLGEFESALKLIGDKEDCFSIWSKWFIYSKKKDELKKGFESQLKEKNCKQSN